MQVFVTGATGYIGSAICDALRSAGHTPFGLVRTPEKAELLRARGGTPIVGDLRDLDLLTASAKDADAVIHTAMEWSPETGKLDAAATGAMVTALRGSNRPLIYTSGVWVMGDTGGRMNGEISAIHPPPLVAWRPAVEEMVIEAGGVVLRPGMVFGRASGFVGSFFRSARERGAVRVIGHGENHWSNVHVDDLADLYCRAIADLRAGELFLACSGMPHPVKRIAHAVAKAAGVEGKVEFVEVEEARKSMGPMADCLAMDLKAGSTKAIRFYGWAPKMPYIFDEIEHGSYTAAVCQ
jgi:nucleoside-diphosphate-sugar epimerase